MNNPNDRDPRDAIQFVHIHDIPASGVPALLVHLQTAEVAESAATCGELRVLRMVGLAVSRTDYHHITEQLLQRSAHRTIRGPSGTAACH